MSVQRIGQQALAAWTAMTAHLLLASGKAVLGLLGSSQAMLADAAVSAGKTVRYASMASDVKRSAVHGADPAAEPRNKGRSSSLLSSVVVVVLGLEIVLRAGQSLFGSLPEAPALYIPVILVFSFLLRGFFLLRRRKQASEHRAENAEAMSVWITGIAAVGAVLSYAGGRLDAKPLLYFDSAAAVLCGLLMLRNGYETITSALRSAENADTAVYEHTQELTELVQRIHGVITVDEIEGREAGHYVAVRMKISVNPLITVAEGQDVAKTVKAHIKKRYTHISDVQVQVSPYETGYPYKKSVDSNQDPIPTLLQ
ncbi:cation diffusion facilitator family transporter [Paenibacillus gansuensis]|uniref:Cation diffusion facilitator family transporter n=1 Tax=Paenibacillus gansuensis TaxID=306542 RepID=A0ABW5PDN0_9BACL